MPRVSGSPVAILATGSMAACLLAALPVEAQNCGGVERWAVKVAADSNASQIDTQNPLTHTVHQLATVPPGQIPSGDSARANSERTVYVVDGRLVRFKLESGRSGDQDYHLVVTDDTLSFASGQNNPGSTHSFIAEIVDPNCVMGRHGAVTTASLFANELQTVKAAFEQQFTNISGGWNDAGGIPVRVTGVGFFDRPHGQTGRATNGIELHPVLDIVFNPPPPGVAPPLPTTTLANAGFEQGSQGWTASSGVITDDTREPARTGSRKGWLGGYGSTHTDNLCRQINIPSSAVVATMTFYLHVSTEELTSSQQYDTLQVQVRNTPNQVLQTLATLSNLQAQPGYQLRTFNITSYRGQTVRFCLRAREDNGSMTSFVVDDFGFAVE